MTAQPGLCQTWSETPKTGFLRTRLKCARRGDRSQDHLHPKQPTYDAFFFSLVLIVIYQTFLCQIVELIDILFTFELCCEKKRSLGFLTRADTNRARQPHKMARGLKFLVKDEEGLYYLYSENKGADQLRGYREADLRLCFRICKMLVFSRRGSIHQTFLC